MKRLQQVAKEYGFGTTGEMLMEYMNEAVVPGICDKCGYICSMEPDGYAECEECGKGKVESILLIAGLI